MSNSTANTPEAWRPESSAIFKQLVTVERRLDWFIASNPDHADSILRTLLSDVRVAIAKATGNA